MRMARHWSGPLLAVALAVTLGAGLLAGCSEDEPPERDDGPTASPTASPTGPPTVGPPTTSPSPTPSDDPEESPVETPRPGSATEQAVADLAERLGVAPEAVQVVAVEEVTWRDGSLGCAQEGFSYTQALTPGSRITLRVEGTEYEYHAGGRRDAFLCEEPTQ